MNTLEFLMAIVNWVQADPSHAIVAASAIAALTPTPSPDTPWGRVYKALDLLALNFMHAKETGVNAATVAEEVAAILAKSQTAKPVAPINSDIPH